MDENLIKFGRLWKCYDVVGSLGIDYLPGILEENTCDHPGMLLGGTDGSSFLVCSSGLEQPRAKRGVVIHSCKPPYKSCSCGS